MGTVHHKKKSSGNNVGGHGQSVVKFFVSNLPDGCRPWDVASIFREFGDIAGIYLARKGNREGLKFGFVSFKGVRNWRDLENNLRNIKMGKNSLNINVARHAKENEEAGIDVETKRQSQSVRAQGQPPRNGNGGLGMNHNDKSFVDVVKGYSGGFTKEAKIHVNDDTNEFSSLHGRAVVVKCCNIETLMSAGSLLGDFCDDGLKLHYLGGLSMLVVFLEEDGVKKFLYAKDIWRDWFSKMEVWSGQSFPFERLAWVTIYGIPLHLSSAVVFNKIGERFGKVVQESRFNLNEKNKAWDGVRLLVGEGEDIKNPPLLDGKTKHTVYGWWKNKSIGPRIVVLLGITNRVKRKGRSEIAMHGGTFNADNSC